MSAPSDLWDRYQRYFRYYPAVGLSLDISRMRFPESFFSSMKSAMDRAFLEMADLEKGGIANPDERRMVGHYWLRAPELAPTPEIADGIQQSLNFVLSFAKQVYGGEIRCSRAANFSRVLLLGIGGSALGPQLVIDSLGSEAERRIPLSFLDNTDPDGIARTVREIGDDLASTLVIVVSKSGSTVETQNCVQELAAQFHNRHLRFQKHAVAVTCRGSKLDQRAAEEGWLERFPMWDWVGGRTSLFSAVGLLPAALGGVDVEAMLSGARLMDEETRVQDALRNPAALLALMWHYAGSGRGEKDMVVLPYKDRLVLFSKYLQQLVMESLGKERDLQGAIVHQGIAVYGNKGSTDQHAYVQQLRDGVPNFFVTFIQVLADYCNGSDPLEPVELQPHVQSSDYLMGFLFGTRAALYENGRDSLTIALDQLDAKSLGALIALYERAVGFYASLVRINAYHQPGVEAGKKAAEQIIRLQREVLELLAQNRNRDFSVPELARLARMENERETLFHILEHLAANPSRRIVRNDERDPAEVRYRMVG